LIDGSVAAAGLLATDASSVPVEVSGLNEAGISFRKATTEQEAVPSLPDNSDGWKPSI
jgi:hypothetical protein